MILAYLHPGWVPHEFMESVMLAMRDPDLKLKRVSKRSGPGIARARNEVAHWFVQSGEDRILWVDADMAFTPEDIKALVETGEDLVAGLCARVDEDGSTRPAAVQRNALGFYPWKIPTKPSYLEEVDGVGMAFTLVSRDVYVKLDPRPGHPHIERLVDGHIVGEDVGFCQHAIEAGFQPKVATGVSIGHVKSKVFYP